MCPLEQDLPTWQAGSSLGLCEPSSTHSRQEVAGGSTWVDSSQPRARLTCAWLVLAAQGQLATSPTLSPQNTRHLLHRHCICLRESLLKCLAQPKLLQGVSNFSPHFRTWPPAPFRWGGGSHSVFPKTQFLVHNVYFLRRGN